MKIKFKEFNHSGFSLIEILVCLFFFSILGGLFSISFLSMSPKYKLQRAVWEIRSRLNFARYRAVFEGEKMRVSFDSQRYKIEQYDEDLNQWSTKLEDILEGVTVKANNSPLFHPGGSVSNLATIYVSNSWGEYKITIAITGRIKVWSPILLFENDFTVNDSKIDLGLKNFVCRNLYQISIKNSDVSQFPSL